MIWGTRYYDRPSSKDSRRVYLWFPRRLVDGRLGWFEYASKAWWTDPQENWAGGNSRYVYRIA